MGRLDTPSRGVAIHTPDTAARRAYFLAVECGAHPHIAFDVACAAYRVFCPAISSHELQALVARSIASMDVRGWKCVNDTEEWSKP
jgi:hypothetical protein